MPMARKSDGYWGKQLLVCRLCPDSRFNFNLFFSIYPHLHFKDGTHLTSHMGCRLSHTVKNTCSCCLFS